MYALLLADDPDESAILSTVLQRVGLAVTSSQTLSRVLKTWSERPADIILAAVSSPGPMEQVRLIRQEAQVPLVLVTNPLLEQPHCSLLEEGADLVVPRPYSPRLLIAQVRVLLRRSGGVTLLSLPTLQASDLYLDPATRSVQARGRPLKHLTHLEFRLLYTLMSNRGQALATETIIERVWGYDGHGDRDLVRGLVKRLRDKIELDPRHPYYILTIPGVGYRFRGDIGSDTGAL